MGALKLRGIGSRAFQTLLALSLILSSVILPVAQSDTSDRSRAYGIEATLDLNATNNVASLLGANAEKPPADLTITTAAELFNFADAVNAGDSFSEKIVRLDSNIDLGGVEWTPIGSYGAMKPFAGVFDGNGNMISGLSITSGNNVALFGYLTGEVMDLVVEGTVSGGEYVAGVVARLAGTIRGVVNRVLVFASGSFVGGVAADAAGTFLITDCANEGSVTNFSNTQSSGKLGGILGRADTGMNGVIERCQNTADITGYQYLGGIAGGIFAEVAIRGSFNTGTIEGKSFGKVYLGGIVGKLQEGTIDSCYNRGTVYGNRANQGMGHIRAIGGIVGCEEDHTVGTAISNVYQAGSISFNATGLDPLLDSHYVMMTGRISGGNNSTSTNTMTYEDCFYEAGCYPQAEQEHPDFIFFRHDEGTALWDTPFVIEVTTDELKAAELLAALGSAFEADTRGINDGYPVLAWQNGGTDLPVRYYVVRELVALGGTAEASVQPQQAAEGETMSIVPTAIESGKRVYRVVVTDVAGASVAVNALADGSYTFAMPGRDVRVELILENDVAGGEAYPLAMPENLDAIWTLWAESSGALVGTSDTPTIAYTMGSTVLVYAQKNPDAFSTTLLGVSVVALNAGATSTKAVDIPVTTLKEGLYAFTMPASAAELSLDVSYASLAVVVQTGEIGAPRTAKTYSRLEMEELAQEDVYYSGWSSESDPMIGHADSAVALSALLADTGVIFEAGDILRIGSIDGMSLSYSYEELMATPRYYYPNLFDESTLGRATFEPILTIQQNVVLRSEEAGVVPPAGDTLNAYRFIFGQSEDEFTNHTKVVDRLVKYVTSVTVVKPSVLGDVDGDAVFSMADIILMVRSLLEPNFLTDAQQRVADMDGDNVLTTRDLIYAVRLMLGVPL
jgi:hypothetical protein